MSSVVSSVVRSMRLGDPLRRSFLDELARRVLLPRPLAAEWGAAGADLIVAVIDDGGPTLVLAAGALAGERRWALRQPLDDFEIGDLVDVRAREFESAGHAPDPARSLAGDDVARLIDAIAAGLDHLAVLRPEQASVPRTLAALIRQAAQVDDLELEVEVEVGVEVGVEAGVEPATVEPTTVAPATVAPATVAPSGPRPIPRRSMAARVSSVAVVGGIVTAAALAWTLVASGGAAEKDGPDPPTSDPTAAAAVIPDFTVQARNADGSAVRFDPCRSYEYVVQAGSLPPEEAAAEVGAAFAALEEASGVAFRFSGFSEERFPEPVDPEHLPGLPILVSYETAPDSPALREGRHAYGGEAGRPLGGLALGKPAQVRPDLTVIAGGALVVDSGLSSEQRARILLHELGHLAGLGHAADPSQMMAPAVPNDGPLVYREGDRAGLSQLGATGGCALTDAERTAVFG